MCSGLLAHSFREIKGGLHADISSDENVFKIFKLILTNQTLSCLKNTVRFVGEIPLYFSQCLPQPFEMTGLLSEFHLTVQPMQQIVPRTLLGSFSIHPLRVWRIGPRVLR